MDRDNSSASENNPELINTVCEATDLIYRAKAVLGINKPNEKLSDNEIRIVCYLIAVSFCLPGSKLVKDKLQLGKDGWEMLFYIVIQGFPWFYEKYSLSQTC